MIDIRVADLSDPGDANALLGLMAQYALDPMGGGQPLSAYTQQNLVSVLLQRQDYTVILAYDNNRAVGVCNCFEGFSTFACKPLINIHDVFVEQHYRGHGIAGRMLQMVEQLARKKGYCKVTLEVLAHNDAARKCYRASGYQPFQLDPEFGKAEFWQKLIIENN